MNPYPTAGEQEAATFPKVDIKGSIARCEFKSAVTSVYYPALKLFKAADVTTAEANSAMRMTPKLPEGEDGPRCLW